MTQMKTIIEKLKSEWSKPKKGNHDNEETLFELSCKLSNKIGKIPDDFPFKVPDDLKDFWSNTEEAFLFKDEKYGQWGLRIYSPENALLETRKENIERDSDYKSTELIIGEFIGDSDKLLIDCDERKFGKIIISLPIDSRQNWYVVANTFTDFLRLYIEKDGEKFWEKDH